MFIPVSSCVGPRTGASRVPLLVVVTLLSLVLLLQFLPGGGGAREELDPAGGFPSASDSGAVLDGLQAPDGSGRLASTAGLAVAVEGGLSIPVGVRLSGEGQLTGRVLDRAKGAGVSGVRVDLLAVPPVGASMISRIFQLAKFSDGSRRRLTPVATVATTTAGSFSFTGVRQGSYFIEARGAWHVPENPVQARVAPSGSGGPVDVWVRAGGRILGIVRDRAGTPVRGAHIAVSPGETSALQMALDGDLRLLEAKSGADGRFIVTGVPAGSGYTVAAMGAGFTVSHLRQVSVSAGGDTEVEVRMRDGATITGIVYSVSPNAEGELVTRPLPGAHLGVIPRGLRDLQFALELVQLTHAQSDASGRYVLRNVPPGEVDVIAFSPGHLNGTRGPVRCSEGMRTEALALELRSGPVVSVRVIDSSGSPLAGVQLSWFTADWNEDAFEPSFTPLLTQSVKGFEFPLTDPEGVAVAGPFPGDAPHELYVWKAGYAFHTEEWNPDENGDSVEITLRAGGAVEGIVMDASRAQPIDSFTISSFDRLESVGEAPSGFNPFSGGVLFEGEGGRFRLEGIAPGETTLSIAAPGFQSGDVEVVVEEGKPTRGIIVKLSPGGVIRGRVLDSDGVPVVGAQIKPLDAKGRSLTDTPGRTRINPRAQRRRSQSVGLGGMEIALALGLAGPDTAASGADGEFELTGVPAGSVIVAASHRDHIEGHSEALVLAEGEAVEGVEVILTEGSVLFGQVTDRHDRPVSGVMVIAFAVGRFSGGDSTRIGIYQAGTESEGNYRIEHMLGGSYFVAAMRGDEALNLMSFLGTMNFDLVTVPNEGSVRYDVIDTSAAGCRVYGSVVADGAPVSRGGIFAMGFESDNILGVDVKVAQIHADGTYEFEGLAPGFYQFSLDSDAGGAQIDVEVPDLQEWRVDLALPDGSLGGRVVDAESGEPVTGAEVILRRDEVMEASGFLGSLLASEGRAERDFTNKDGEFLFERLPAGDYEMEVRSPRWGPQKGRYAPSDAESVTVLEGVKIDDVLVRLDPTLIIEGIVLSESGEPVHKAEVLAILRGSNGARPSRDRTEEDGAFELRSLAPGSYDVVAMADGYADSLPVGVDLDASGVAPLELLLKMGVEVFVMVTDAEGRPLQGATGQLSLAEGTSLATRSRGFRAIEGLFSGEGLSGVDGRLNLGRFAPGTYRLEVRRGALIGTIEEVGVSDGPAVGLSIDLRK